MIQWHLTPVFLLGKSHGWRSLVVCSPWGSEELDKTERLHFHFSLSCIGEGNGNPLQCSWLENPRDGGAWWAAVSGVTQSQTWLKRLSSSSSSSSDNSEENSTHQTKKSPPKHSPNQNICLSIQPWIKFALIRNSILYLKLKKNCTL